MAERSDFQPRDASDATRSDSEAERLIPWARGGLGAGGGEGLWDTGRQAEKERRVSERE